MKKKGKLMRVVLALALWVLALSAMAPGVSAASQVKLSSASMSVLKGKSKTLSVSGTKKTVSWSSSDSSVATVSKTGTVTGKKKGTAVITAAVGGKKYQCKVSVKQPVTSIALNQKNIAISAGKSYTLTATVKPTTASKKTVKWSSSDKSVVTVNSKGKLTAVKTGTAVITAKAADGSGKKAQCKITVKKRAASANAKKFLSILQKYSNRVKSDAKKDLVWSYSNDAAPSTWSKAVEQVKEKGITYCNCALLARWGLREMGIIGGSNFWGRIGGEIEFRGYSEYELKESCDIIKVFKTPEQLLKAGNLLPGDICTWVEYQHTNIYAGDGLWYDGGRGINYKDGAFTSFGPAAAVNMSGTTVGYIIRLR